MSDALLMKDGTATAVFLGTPDGAIAAAAAVTATAEATSAQASAASAAATLVAQAALATTAVLPALPCFTPELYLAVGDGAANDTVAFQNLAAAVNASGGGLIYLKPGATYLVGLQTLVNNATYMWQAQDILTITGCTKPVIIQGNGATFKIAAGLKFGTFNADGTSHGNTAPFTNRTYYCNVTPDLSAVIGINNCSAAVEVRDVVLDGNLANLMIGGNFGDTGWQVGGDGLMLFDNTGGELVENVRAHDFPRDGALGWRSLANSDVKRPSVFRQLDLSGNGRQGFSLVGGRSYTFDHCKFRDTGKNGLYSSPGAGIDLEPAGSSILREVAFRNCLFSNCTGAGMLCDGTNTEDVAFDLCTFIGATSWSAWPNAGRFRFKECRFIGAINLPYQPTDPVLAPSFRDCKFSDDPTLSPTGTAYGRAGLNTAGANPTYAYCKRCSWDAGHQDHANLGYGAILEDCSVTVAGSFTIGIGGLIEFKGRTNMTGTGVAFGNMPNGIFGGLFTLNGVVQMRGSATYDPPSLANGAGVTTTITVPGAALGQRADATFSLALQGIRMFSWISAANTESVRFENNTGGTIDLASGTIKGRAVNMDATV